VIGCTLRSYLLYYLSISEPGYSAEGAVGCSSQCEGFTWKKFRQHCDSCTERWDHSSQSNRSTRHVSTTSRSKARRWTKASTAQEREGKSV